MTVCKFYLQGKCRNGQQCRFSHSPIQAGASDSKNTFTPHFHGKGQSKTLTGGQRRERRMLKAVDKQIGIINVTTPKHEREVGETVKIADYQFLGSYNWKDTIEPIIYVPGCPAKWTPPVEMPHQLQRDNAKAGVGRKVHRSPAAPLDPFFQALLHMHPDYNMRPIELVTDRNSLRKLLEFASDRGGSWRIDVDLIQDTMFFSQWEEERIKIINMEQDTGYGHGFEKDFTTFDPGLEDSICHNRIVRYKLGGMDCMVRFEADAYVESEASLTSVQSDPADNALESMAAVSIKDTSAIPPPSNEVQATKSPYRLVQLTPLGRLVDPADITEVKSPSKPPKPAKHLPQLWFSQTTNLCIGIHKDGLIENTVRLQKMETELAKWEKNNQGNLLNMVRVILEIKDMARKVEGGKCVVILNQTSKPRILKVYQRGGIDLVLRAGIKETCWGADIKV